MAKEMMIVFVYDTQLLQREEDDPASAVLYFHPGWVSDEQKIALCGQIMGTYNFLKSTFAKPKIVSLQSGKFAMKEYGRYTLAIGTDRNIPDWVLEHRKDIMDSLITFYHNDLPTMSMIYENRYSLCGKLYLVLENYLRVLIYSGSGFSNIPTIQVPKSASSVFLESLQILQHCQESEYVLGGLMLYHNMVLSTQLSTSLTQRFVLTDPYRIKSPAELVNVSFVLPQGVQLLQVYLDELEYFELKDVSSRYRAIFDKSFKSKNSSRFNEPVFSAIKREQSIIFTTVPEEETSPHSPNFQASVNITPAKKNRPKFLNLRSNTIDSSDICKIIPSTPFRGQTSVCSTPMTELNKVLHQSVLSICLNHEIEENKSDDNNDSGKNNSVNSAEFSHTALLANFRAKPYFPLDNAHLTTLQKYASTSNLLMQRNLLTVKRNSVADATFHALKSDNKLISKSLYKYLYIEQTKLINFEPSQINTVKSTVDTTASFEFTGALQMQSAVANDGKLSNDRSDNAAQRRRSLNLPLKSLSFDAPPKPLKASQGVLLTPLMSKLTILADDQSSSGFSSRTSTPSPTKEFNEDEESRRRENIISRGLIVRSTEIAEDLEDAARRNNNNRDVRVPSREVSVERIDEVCSLSAENSSVLLETSVDSASATNRNRKESESFKRRRSGAGNVNFKVRADTGCQKKREMSGMKRAVLFVCGQEDMVVGMILEEEAVADDAVVKKLYEVCVDHLHHLSKTLAHSLSSNPYPSASANSSLSSSCPHPSARNTTARPSTSQSHQQTGNEPPYSYLSVNADQCSVQRAGPWAGNGFGMVTYLHKDFRPRSGAKMTEIVLRKHKSKATPSEAESTEPKEPTADTNIQEQIVQIPKFLKRFYCPHLLNGSYVLAVAFLTLTAINIYVAYVLLNMGYTRSAQIYMGFQIILLMPFIPLIIGTLFLSRFLIVPFMAGLIITTILHLLWLMFIIFGYDAALNEDFYIENVTTRTIVISLWSVCVVFSAFSFMMILVLWYTIGAKLSLPQESEKHAVYPLRRFDDEAVVYAYKSGNTEIFYHQAANGSVAGLPPPADLMGTASIKARRRLERDQAVILL